VILGFEPGKPPPSAMLLFEMKFNARSVIPKTIKIVIINFSVFFTALYLLYFFITPFSNESDNVSYIKRNA